MFRETSCVTFSRPLLAAGFLEFNPGVGGRTALAEHFHFYHASQRSVLARPQSIVGVVLDASHLALGLRFDHGTVEFLVPNLDFLFRFASFLDLGIGAFEAMQPDRIIGFGEIDFLVARKAFPAVERHDGSDRDFVVRLGCDRPCHVADRFETAPIHRHTVFRPVPFLDFLEGVVIVGGASNDRQTKDKGKGVEEVIQDLAPKITTVMRCATFFVFADSERECC